MFRNYLVTALRNMARNRFYAAISILGLAAALATAILIALFVRFEFSYDRWLPDYRAIYKLTSSYAHANRPPDISDRTQPTIAGELRAVLPGAAIARLNQDFPTIHRVAGDEGVVDQTFSWADPEIFSVLPLRALSGNLKTALDQPDTVVMTRKAARVYFGRDLPVGATLDVQQGDQHFPMRVAAILKDLPANTSLVTEIFASSRSAYSPLSHADLGAPRRVSLETFTFVRLASGQSVKDLQRALTVAAQPEYRIFDGGGDKLTFVPIAMANLHMHPPGMTAIVTKPIGSRATALAVSAVGLLIVLVAGINFVTLMTARATRRAVEVGVRKASGARRADLVIQFMGEALVQAALAMALSIALAAILVGPFGAFVQRDLSFDLVRDPLLALGLVVATLVIGLLGGFYPALVLSSFRPAAVLKGGAIQSVGSVTVRQALVVVQFAILIGLAITTTTIYRQTLFALDLGTGAVRAQTIGVWTPCVDAFPEEVRRLAGVKGAACSSLSAINAPSARALRNINIPGGQVMTMANSGVDFGFFELFGVRPLAGRLFAADHPGDAMGQGDTAGLVDGSSPGFAVVINERAARALGFSTPSVAIGRTVILGYPQPIQTAQIIGVVADLPGMAQTIAAPTFYFIPPNPGGMLSIRLAGKDIPGTVKAIERVWRSTGHIRPIQEVFYAQSARTQNLDIIIQGATIGICSAAAVIIACLGLFALSAYTTERRTKEIGIRKAMGASTFDVVRLLMWQFTIPVLWAIVIALPIVYLLMTYWLSGYAYHVDLSLWTFVLAAMIALLIAWFTVSFQSYMVAKAKPVEALRYE